MRYLKFIVVFIAIFSLTNCEKHADLVNKTTDAQIVGFVPEKCYCCWGWVIRVGTETFKTEHIPDLTSSENTVFPINVRITIGQKTLDCSGRANDGTGFPDYYEIKECLLLR